MKTIMIVALILSVLANAVAFAALFAANAACGTALASEATPIEARVTNLEQWTYRVAHGRSGDPAANPLHCYGCGPSNHVDEHANPCVMTGQPPRPYVGRPELPPPGRLGALPLP